MSNAPQASPGPQHETGRAATTETDTRPGNGGVPGGIEPGRPIVLEPLKPGMWQLLLGVCLAALGPLFGFLVGSIIGIGDPEAEVNPMFLSLFIGILVGAVGVLFAILGGVRLWKDLRRG